MKEELAGPFRTLQETARRIAKVCKECRMPLEEDEYVGSFKSDMMEVLRSWCTGSKFIDICKVCDCIVALSP